MEYYATFYYNVNKMVVFYVLTICRPLKKKIMYYKRIFYCELKRPGCGDQLSRSSSRLNYQNKHADIKTMEIGSKV